MYRAKCSEIAEERSKAKPLSKKDIRKCPDAEEVYEIGVPKQGKFKIKTYLGQTRNSRKDRLAQHERGNGN